MPSAPATNGPLSIGMIGSGFNARFHIRSLVSVRDCTVGGITSPNPEHAREAAGLATELGVGEGDLLFPVRSPEGVGLTPYDPEFAEAIADGRDFMRRHRNAMRELAKG